MKLTVSRLVAVFAPSFFGAGLAFSQNVTGSISGVAKDPSGSVVPSITVLAINEGTGARFQTTTDSDGHYTIRAVPIGEAMMAVTLADHFLRHRGQTGRDGGIGY